MSKRDYKNYWKEKDASKKIKKSAIKLAQIIVDSTNNDILETHKKKLLSLITWFITESDGKYETRFVSEDVLNGITPIEHEHVFTRRKTVEEFIINPGRIEEIAINIIGCLVTKQEHNKLSKIKTEYGWDRYKEAGIKVFDRKNQKFVTF